MSTSKRNRKGKAPMANTDIQYIPFDEALRIVHLCFGLARMEEYYVSFKEKRSINAGLNLRMQQRILKHKGRVDTILCLLFVWVWGQEVNITPEVINSIDWATPIQPDETHVNVRAIIAEQFKMKAKQQATLLPYPSLLKIAQMGQSHESQIVKLSKAIPSMIQQAMQPAREKLRGLYAKVDALENEVITLRNEVANPSWKSGGLDTNSYHELRTLPDKWVVFELGNPLERPPDPIMPYEVETVSWNEATYSWVPRPNH
ncbi:hypothetical protein HAX54_039519 [Datura stramonium]|uniref:Uncharacterized protein n=1 Tax=Datura stramonium TaxID=4076 RepID=A0ABS8SJB1_DATST|nr:hypothetical protein [Datura stramonium]